MAWDAVDEIADVVADLRQAVVYFLGATDVGKTTLVTQLANRLLGSPIAILDADIGQSGVLPLTISLLRVERPFSAFSELVVVRQHLVPGYNLIHYLERNARAVGELAKEARGWARYILVDTTGFVTGAGIHLKKREVEEVQPDLVVALQRSYEIRAILRGLECPALVYPVPSSVGRKSWEERRRRRVVRLRNYLQKGSVREVRVRASILTAYQHAGRIVGLYEERFLGLGVVVGVGEETLKVLTPVVEALQKIEFTSVWLPLEEMQASGIDGPDPIA